VVDYLSRCIAAKVRLALPAQRTPGGRPPLRHISGTTIRAGERPSARIRKAIHQMM
jgi:hypothetical protein